MEPIAADHPATRLVARRSQSHGDGRSRGVVAMPLAFERPEGTGVLGTTHVVEELMSGAG
jgi:hypothetical protein